MSYFFAFEVPDKARVQIAAFAERWQSQVDPVLNARWVVPENYHITLKYLGDMSPEMVDSVIKRAGSTRETEEAVIEQKPSVIFPAGRPPVLWIEIIPTDLLKSLAWDFKLFPNLDWNQREHRPYKPHITLAYCKPEAESGPVTLTEQAFDPFTLNRFVLMQTLPPERRAKDSKSRYTVVHTFPFGDTQSS